MSLLVILPRLAKALLFPDCFNRFRSASGLSSMASSDGGVFVTGVRPLGFSSGVSGGAGTFGR